MSNTIIVTLSDLVEQFAKMPTLTAKQCSAYVCGMNTYKAVKAACDVKDDCAHLMVSGVRIYPSNYAPDNSKLYPADYIESKVGWPYEVAR